MSRTLTDSDPMPFGKHEGEKMEDVPASYLLWLKDQGCSHVGVRDYIFGNLAALLKDCPDYINEARRDDFEHDQQQSLLK